MPSRGPCGVRGGADGRRPARPQGDTADPQKQRRERRCRGPTGASGHGHAGTPTAPPPAPAPAVRRSPEQPRVSSPPLPPSPGAERAGGCAAPHRAAASHNSLTQRRRRWRGAVPPPPCSAAAALPGPAQRHPRGGSNTKARSSTAPAGTPLAWLPPRVSPCPASGAAGKPCASLGVKCNAVTPKSGLKNKQAGKNNSSASCHKEAKTSKYLFLGSLKEEAFLKPAASVKLVLISTKTSRSLKLC